MKVIFIGNLIKEKIFGKNKEYKYTSFADNFMQIKFVNEIHLKYKNDFEIVTINYEDKHKYKKGKFYNINATYIKYSPKNAWTYYLSFMFNIFKEVLNICKKYKKEELIIITNGPYIYIILSQL